MIIKIKDSEEKLQKVGHTTEGWLDESDNSPQFPKVNTSTAGERHASGMIHDDHDDVREQKRVLIRSIH